MAIMKKAKMTRTICAVVGTLVIVASLLVPVTLAAAETTKGRTVFFVTKMEEVQVGEVQGQTVGMYETRGLSSDENGETAIVMDYGTFDFMEGFKGYEVLTFEDGSTQWIKYQGTATPAQEGKIMLYEGTFEFIKGTGRFEGIEGTGTFTGKNFITYGIAYIDFTGSYTLTSQ